MDAAIKVTQAVKVGENDCGYEFYTGLCDGRWIGYAVGATDDGQRMMFVFPQISDGRFGLKNRHKAILLTGALAQDPENGFGGIDRWCVAEDWRGDPETFRCLNCERVGCDGVECRQDEEPDGP